MRLVLGVDPGATGAIAAVDLDDENRLHGVEDMPMAGGFVAVPLLLGIVERLGRDAVVGVVVEKVNAMPGQGVTSMFKFGRSYGTVLGFFGASWPVTDVTPQVWKKHLGLIGQDKDVARARAIQRWPQMAEYLARKKDIGRADAALIALWAAETQDFGALVGVS